jgi:hypothetical protein
MKRVLDFIWEVLQEIGQARAQQRLGRQGWDY